MIGWLLVRMNEEPGRGCGFKNDWEDLGSGCRMRSSKVSSWLLCYANECARNKYLGYMEDP